MELLILRAWAFLRLLVHVIKLVFLKMTHFPSMSLQCVSTSHYYLTFKVLPFLHMLMDNGR